MRITTMKPLVENIPRSLENSLCECCHCNCIGLPFTWLFYVCGFAVRYILYHRKVGNRHLGELVPLLTFRVNKRLRYVSNLACDVPFVRNALSMCKDGGWETWREKLCVGVRKISGKNESGLRTEANDGRSNNRRMNLKNKDCWREK